MRLLIYSLFLLPTILRGQTKSDARQLLNDGDFNNAIQVLEAIDKDGEVLFFLGYASYNLGLLNESLIHYSEAIPQLEGDWRHRAICAKAEILRKNNLPEEALKILQSTGVDSYWKYYNLATINRDLGFLDEAVTNALFARSLAPDSIEINDCYNLIGRIFQLDGAFTASNTYFDSAYYGNRFYGKALHNKAWNSLYSGDTIQAISNLKIALLSREGNEKFLTLKDLGFLLGDSKYLKESVKYLPDNPDRDEFDVFLHLHDITGERIYLDKYLEEYDSYSDRTEESHKLYRKFSTINALSMFQKHQQLQASNKWKRSSIIAISAFFGIVVILLFLFRKNISSAYRYVRDRQKIRAEIKKIEDF